jgi:hypothetical protein
VFNRIFELRPHLCTRPIQIISEFQTQIQPQTPGRFSQASQSSAPIGRWVTKQTYVEYPFEHGEVDNYTLDGVSIYPVSTKTLVSFLTQLPERKENAQGFHHEVNGHYYWYFWNFYFYFTTFLKKIMYFLRHTFSLTAKSTTYILSGKWSNSRTYQENIPGHPYSLWSSGLTKHKCFVCKLMSECCSVLLAIRK